MPSPTSWISLWPMCGFADGEAAAAAYRAGFPHAPADEHLTDYLDQIADSATAG